MGLYQSRFLACSGDSATNALNSTKRIAVRAVFFIDPNKKIRLIMYYPLNVGRNMDEIKRTLEALQTADEYKCAMPLNWKKGEKVIVPPPKTMTELEERLASKYEMVDFYLAKKELV